MPAPTFGGRFARVDSAKDPAELVGYLDWVRALDAVRTAKATSFALLRVAPGSRVLDVGCGTGDDAREMEHLVGAEGQVVGLDSSTALIAEAIRRRPGTARVRFEVGDAEQLNHPDCAFDACRADRTLQHVADPERALRELARVCTPGGTIVVSEMTNELLVDGEPEGNPVSRMVLEGLWSPRERRGWIGHLLPFLLQRAGLGVEVERSAAHTSDWTQIEGLLRLGVLAGEAVRLGRVSEVDAQRWVEELERDAASGRLVLRMTFLHVAGRLPA